MYGANAFLKHVSVVFAMTFILAIWIENSQADDVISAHRVSLSSGIFEGMLLLPKSCAVAIKQSDAQVIYFECEFPAGTGKFWAGIDDETRLKDTEDIDSFVENFKPRLKLSNSYAITNYSGSMGRQGGYRLGRAFGIILNRDLGPRGTITHRYAAKFFPGLGSDRSTAFIFGLMQLRDPIEIRLAGVGDPPKIVKRFAGFEDIIKNFAIVDAENNHNSSFGSQWN